MLSTEIGGVVYLIPEPTRMNLKEWDYFRISPHIDIKMIPQEGQPGIFEPVAFVRRDNDRMCLPFSRTPSSSM